MSLILFGIVWGGGVLYWNFRNFRKELLEILLEDFYKKIGLEKKQARNIKIVYENQVNSPPNYTNNPIELLVRNSDYVLYEYSYDIRKSPCFEKSYSSLTLLFEQFLKAKVEKVITLRSYQDKDFREFKGTERFRIDSKEELDGFSEIIKRSRRHHEDICWKAYKKFTNGSLLKFADLLSRTINNIRNKAIQATSA